MIDIPVKPYFRTLWQTAIILNITNESRSRATAERTIRRLIKMGELEGACPFPGNRGVMVTVESIQKYIEKIKLSYENETDKEVEEKMQIAMTTIPNRGRRLLSRGIK